MTSDSKYDLEIKIILRNKNLSWKIKFNLEINIWPQNLNFPRNQNLTSKPIFDLKILIFLVIRIWHENQNLTSKPIFDLKILISLEIKIWPQIDTWPRNRNQISNFTLKYKIRPRNVKLTSIWGQNFSNYDFIFEYVKYILKIKFKLNQNHDCCVVSNFCNVKWPKMSKFGHLRKNTSGPLV